MQGLNAGVVVVECDLIFVRILKQVERIDPAFVELSRFWIDSIVSVRPMCDCITCQSIEIIEITR